MSSEPKAFRQLCDKPNSSEISSMLWSPTSDLVAVLTVDGEVRLHRLYWGKVWSYAEKDSRVTVTAWSPSGNVLALGIDNGLIQLIEIEKCKCIHLCDTGSVITAMEWIETHEPDMSLLLVGNEAGSINLFVNGIFKIMAIDDSNGLAVFGSSVVNLFMSKSLKLLVSLYSDERDENSQHQVFKFHKFELISTRTKEVKTIAEKYEKIHAILQKLGDELTQISDSWENNLQKVSLKLEKLAEILPPDTTVLEEFLMAFASGTLSAELQSFLINELTMKGLKKLGADINTSYDNVKTKAIDNVQGLCYNLSIELSELLGMARWYEKYGVLGLKEADVQDSLNYLGMFMLRIKELLCVIEKDLRSFRAFFKWLSGIMYRISAEPIPTVFKEFNQEENAHILEFLQTQLVKSDHAKSFVLDRVGQYLHENENHAKEVPTTNPWYEFLRTDPSLRDNPLAIMPEKETSLINMGRQLRSKVFPVFDRVMVTMAESFTTKDGPEIQFNDDNHDDFCRPKISWTQRPEDNLLAACVLPCSCRNDNFFHMVLDEEAPDRFKVSKFSIDLADIAVHESVGLDQTVIKDIQFHNGDNITMLLAGTGDSHSKPVHVLAQVDIASVNDVQHCFTFDNSLSATNVTTSVSKWRNIESFEPFSLSVSKTRKVSCLLSSNRRRVRVYDMDAEEEDEEQEDDEEIGTDEYDDDDDSQIEEL